jgi:hypothetical protein
MAVEEVHRFLRRARDHRCEAQRARDFSGQLGGAIAGHDQDLIEHGRWSAMLTDRVP